MQPADPPEAGYSHACAEEHYAAVTDELRQTVIELQAGLRANSLRSNAKTNSIWSRTSPSPFLPIRPRRRWHQPDIIW